ncbi:MAG: glycosyltransferase family 4 protein [Armatimonadota bacterium]
MTPRILHIVRPSAGGIVTSLCTLLAGNDAYVEVAANADTCAKVTPRWPGTCHVLSDNAFSIHQSLPTAVRIARLAKASGFDIVHGHGITVLPALALSGMITGLPVVLTLHNVFRASSMQTLILKLLCRRVHLIAVSDAILASARKLGGRSAQRIYNGVMLRDEVVSKGDARKTLGLDAAEPLVLSVSRLAPEKGLNVLASGAGEIPAKVVILGDGPERQSLSTNDALHLVGHIADPWVWYCAADVVAVPSLTEGLGLSAIEAISSGCPVVASNVGGLPEVISDDYLGTCVPVGDAKALASAIRNHLIVGRGSLADERKRRAYVESKFSVHGMLDATNALYNRMMAK